MSHYFELVKVENLLGVQMISAGMLVILHVGYGNNVIITVTDMCWR